MRTTSSIPVGSASSTANLVADLLNYPDEAHELKLSDALEATNSQSRSSRSLQAYRDEIADLSLSCIQEFYSATFELNPANTLDSSFHIYDGYNRTKCLAKLAAMYRECGFQSSFVEGGELPDYLPVVLKFVATLEDCELLKDFCSNYVIPSLTCLRDSLGKTASPHRHLVDVAYYAADDLSKGGL